MSASMPILKLPTLGEGPTACWLTGMQAELSTAHTRFPGKKGAKLQEE